MTGSPNQTRLSIRPYLPNSAMFGPGKADLLALISETGSIAAAGRKLGMSYKRAWGRVETMNSMFAEPLVESSRGGASHGGQRSQKWAHEFYPTIAPWRPRRVGRQRWSWTESSNSCPPLGGTARTGDIPA